MPGVIFVGRVLSRPDAPPMASAEFECASASTGASPRPVVFATDAIGAYLPSSSGRKKILDLVWGIDVDGDLGFAVLKTQEEDGSIQEYSRPEDYVRLAFAVEELKDFYTYDQNTRRRTLVHSMSLAVLKSGFIGAIAMNGTLADGSPFSFGSPFAFAAQQECCHPQMDEECIPRPANPCTLECPGPDNCACTGTGSCKKITAWICAGSCESACGGGAGQDCTGIHPACDCS